MALPERVSARIKVTDSCWLWVGRKTDNGYGLLDAKIRGRWRAQVAHRYVYEALVGVIPDGLVIDHLCAVRHCVNPAHLEVVTQRENIMRGSRPTSHCPSGHEYASHGKTYTYKDTGFTRKVCMTCNRQRMRRRAS